MLSLFMLNSICLFQSLIHHSEFECMWSSAILSKTIHFVFIEILFWVANHARLKCVRHRFVSCYVETPGEDDNIELTDSDVYMH